MTKIEKNIPLGKKKAKCKYDWPSMSVGDSLIVSDRYSTKEANKLRMAAIQYGKIQDPVQIFRVRQDEDGIRTRAWRLEDSKKQPLKQ